MKRRDFLAGSLGTAAVSSTGVKATGKRKSDREPEGCATGDGTNSTDPSRVTLNVKPVMTSIIHTASWEGPCRWDALGVHEEKANAEKSFAAWSAEVRNGPLAGIPCVRVMEPAHVTFSESFTIPPEEFEKLVPDSQEADVFYMLPAGSSLSGFEVGERFGRPILLKGLGCRMVDIAAYARAKHHEAFVAADDRELIAVARLLRARKVFRQTRVLFPTDRGFPAACSVGSIWDLDALEEKLGVKVTIVPYSELTEAVNRTLGSRTAAEAAEARADELIRAAQKTFLNREYVVRSCQFHRAVQDLMARRQCNAFTIECFEFCSSRLPERWSVTPCLLHSLLRNLQCASSCEGDLGSLLAMRMLMSVSGKSCHQGNSDPRPEETFRINHSAPSMKMNGFDQPDLPYQLGRFVKAGWGTKVVLDFLANDEKTVTVARVNPTADKVLVLRGTLVGASGWDQDRIGCSVEAVIKPPAGRCDEFLRSRLEYGNHLQWVYGDYTDEMRRLGEMLRLRVETIV